MLSGILPFIQNILHLPVHRFTERQLYISLSTLVSNQRESKIRTGKYKDHMLLSLYIIPLCHARGAVKKRLMKIELKLSLAGGATLFSICFMATWAVPPADPPTAPPMIP